MKVYLLTLGCPKNLVDSEILLGHLKEVQVKVTNDLSRADTVLINTCGFLESAREEAVEAILEAAELKQDGKIKKIIVMGCMPQRFGKEMYKLKTEIPEIDAIYGTNSIPQVISYLTGKQFQRYDPIHQRHLLTPPHYAYLKIAEGCNNECSFCSIPLIKGPQVSRPIEELLEEARLLQMQGVQELILIAQDTTAYGWDLKPKGYLHRLLQELEAQIRIPWIRILYTHPAHFTRKLIPVIARSTRIVPYLDIPIQHISDRILKSMQRGLGSDGIRRLLYELRENIPDLYLRTSLIVGYPEETEKDFQQLYDFVEEFHFERLGVFTYSHEEGTPAARLEDKIPERIKEERRDAIMSLQQAISAEKNASFVNQSIEVLIDEVSPEKAIGRTRYDAPEIDNQVVIEKAPAGLNAGEFYQLKILNSDAYTLYGIIDDRRQGKDSQYIKILTTPGN